MNWWQAGTMLLLISITALLMEGYEGRTALTKSSSWIHAVSLGFAAMMFYAATAGDALYEYVGPMEAESLVLAGLVVLLASYGWQQVDRIAFAEHVFFTAYGFYGLGMWLTFSLDFDAVLRAVIMLGGVAMAYLLYRKTGWRVVSYVVSGISLMFYMTVLYVLHSEMAIQSDLFQSLQFEIGAVLLLIVGVLAGKFDAHIRKSFWWAGHLFLPFALLTSFLLFEEKTVWAFLIAAAVYGISLCWAKAEWVILSFLYGCFTAFWIGMVQLFDLLNLDEHIQYATLLTSIAVAVLWNFSKKKWTRRIAFYVVPFSVFGMFLFTLAPNVDTTYCCDTALCFDDAIYDASGKMGSV